MDGKGRYFINYSVGRVGVDGFAIVPIDPEHLDNIEMSQGGDSGSAWILDESDIMVGLHFAGETDPRPSEEHAIACFASRAFSRLSISLLDLSSIEDEFVTSQEKGEEIMSKLTKEYVRDHMVDLHSYESFGRSLLEQIMHCADTKLESMGGEADKIELDAKIVVEPYKPEGCTEITVNLGLVKVKKHI